MTAPYVLLGIKGQSAAYRGPSILKFRMRQALNESPTPLPLTWGIHKGPGGKGRVPRLPKIPYCFILGSAQQLWQPHGHRGDEEHQREHQEAHYHERRHRPEDM